MATLRCVACGAQIDGVEDRAQKDACCASCAGTRAPATRTAPAVSPLSAGLQEEYRIEETLGEGAMGVVYRAIQVRFGRPVAIKMPTVTDASYVARFVREGRVLASLDHPNILRVYDAGEDRGRPYIAFELVSGCTLLALRQGGRLPIAEAVTLGLQLLAGLGHAHAHEVLHRDVKSENALVTADGVLKLVDFGLARSATEQMLTQEGTLMGTPAYMAPEQIQGQPLDQRADLYSAAIVLFELLTGRLPFEASDLGDLLRSQVQVPPPPLESLGVDAPRPLCVALARALSKAREDRFATAAELSQALKNAVGATSAEAIVASLRRRVAGQRTLRIAAAGPGSVGAAPLARSSAVRPSGAGVAGGPTTTPRQSVAASGRSSTLAPVGKGQPYTPPPAEGGTGQARTLAPTSRAGQSAGRPGGSAGGTGAMRTRVTRPAVRPTTTTRPNAALGPVGATLARRHARTLALIGALGALAIAGLGWRRMHGRGTGGPESAPVPDAEATQRMAVLVQALTSGKATIRADAARELGGMDAPTADAVLHLATRLSDTDSGVRENAARALGRWRTGDASTVRGLSSLMRDPVAEVRSAARMAITSIGPAALPVLVQDLRERHHQDRRQALRALAIAGTVNRQMVEGLAERLYDPQDDIPFLAATALGSPAVASSVLATDAVAPLVDALDNARPEVRWRAAEALGRMGDTARAGIDGLVETAVQRGPDARSGQVWALARLLGGSALAAVDSLRSSTGGLGTNVRRDLPAPRPVTSADVRQLSDALKSENKTARMIAAAALGDATVGAGDTCMNLIHALADPDRDVRLSAACALSHMGPAALSPLQIALGSRSPRVRAAAAFAIGLTGEPAAPAVHALMAGLDDHILWVRHESAWALARIGPAAGDAIPSLVRRLFDGPWNGLETQDRAMALVLIGASAVPAILDGLESTDPLRRSRVCEALCYFGSDARAALPALEQCMADGSDVVRYNASKALAELGPSARAALPLLEKALADPYNLAAQIAARAIGLLAPEEAPAVLALRSRSISSPPTPVESGASTPKALASRLLVGLDQVAAPTEVDRALVRGALERLAFLNPEVLALLGELLTQARPDRRVLGADILAQLSACRPEASLALVSALSDQDADVLSAATAGIFLGASAKLATAPLLRLLTGPVVGTRLKAARRLVWLGHRSAQFLDELAGVLDPDKTDGLIDMAPIGPLAARMTPAVLKLVGSGHDYVPSLAEEALALMGPAAIGQLRRVADGTDARNARLAGKALRDIAELEEPGDR